MALKKKYLKQLAYLPVIDAVLFFLLAAAGLKLDQNYPIGREIDRSGRVKCLGLGICQLISQYSREIGPIIQTISPSFFR